MNLVRVVVAALAAVLIGLPGPAESSPGLASDSSAAPVIYSCDLNHWPQLTTRTTAPGAPPSAYLHANTCCASNPRPNGVPARPDSGSAARCYTYDDGAKLAQNGYATVSSQARLGEPLGHPACVARADVAANGGAAAV
jgi:hypothetical protein